MTDRVLQNKLNQIAKLSNELVAEAERRYGREGGLFFEAEGGFHIMSNDSDGNLASRQSFVEFSSSVYSRMGAGAW